MFESLWFEFVMWQRCPLVQNCCQTSLDISVGEKNDSCKTVFLNVKAFLNKILIWYYILKNKHLIYSFLFSMKSICNGESSRDLCWKFSCCGSFIPSNVSYRKRRAANKPLKVRNKSWKRMSPHSISTGIWHVAQWGFIPYSASFSGQTPLPLIL